MNQIFRITNEEIFIDNLILETSGCARDCKNCYVKAHSRSGKDLKPDTWFKLYWTFLMSARHSANQISISVNDRTDNKRNAIDEILTLNRALRNNKTGKNTRLHLTLFSPSTILQYTNLTLEHFALVDSIYFSNIQEEEADIIADLRTLNKNLEIGWNALLTHNQTVPKYIDIVDSIHWVFNKSGESYYPAFYQRANGVKTTTDACNDDYFNWKKDWHNTTCSANISKFTVWPDGSVSGCPYAKQSNTGPATTCEGILKNIVKASEQYGFNDCPMKEIYG